jgi:hypothetical protein
MFGLGGVKRAGQASLDVAEGAGARAGVAHDHERCVLFFPALADIGTTRFLAHGVQAVGAHDLARLGVARRDRRLDPDPVRLGQAGLVRPMRLFRMARPAGIGQNGIDDNGHGRSREAFAPKRYLRGGAPYRKTGGAEDCIAVQASRPVAEPVGGVNVALLLIAPRIV